LADQWGKLADLPPELLAQIANDMPERDPTKPLTDEEDEIR
jgi:hypothetical protein